MSNNTMATDPQRLAQAYMQLHSATQWLARVGASYSQGGNRNKVALWWSNTGRISTPSFDSELGLELRIPDFAMQFTENGTPSHHQIELEERSPAHVEAWILIELLHRGADREKFSKSLPYEVSGLMSGDGVEFSRDEYQPEFAELTSRFQNAASIIMSACDRHDMKEPIRLWPQNMSIEILACPRSGKKSPMPELVFGFAHKNSDLKEPFYYIAHRDGNDGHDRIDARLALSDIPEDQARDRIINFFRDAAGNRGEFTN